MSLQSSGKARLGPVLVGRIRVSCECVKLMLQDPGYHVSACWVKVVIIYNHSVLVDQGQ